MILFRVRLSGPIDYTNDRTYQIRVNPEKSKNAIKDVHYTLNETQIFRKGLYQDSLMVTIHTNAMDETSSYKLYIELVLNENFEPESPNINTLKSVLPKILKTHQPFGQIQINSIGLHIIPKSVQYF